MLQGVRRSAIRSIVVFLGILAARPPVATAHEFLNLYYDLGVNITEEKELRPYRTKKINVKYAEYFPVAIKKRSIFIVGKDVTIDRPVESNGGDVYVFAERLYLSAPIDTRPRIVLSKPFWNDPFQFWSPPFQGDDRAQLHHLMRPNGKLQHVAQAFLDWYYWHDYWDDSCKCYMFRSLTTDVYDYDLHQAKLASADTIRRPSLPIMPYGLMVHRVSQEQGFDPSNGLDAPSMFDRQAFRSGNITVFAHELVFCKNCARTTLQEVQPVNGDPFDRIRTRFFVAGGLKGGRGGVGGTRCLPSLFGVSKGCSNTFGLAGGTSGEPGKGGDAGDVTVYLVDNPGQFAREQAAISHLRQCDSSTTQCVKLDAGAAQSIAALTDVEGGPPSQISLFRTPSFSELNRRKDGVRAKFVESSRVVTPVESLFGAVGSLRIEATTADAAISHFGLLADQASSATNYDWVRAIKCLAANRDFHATNGVQDGNCEDATPGMTTPSVRAMLTRLLESYLVDRQLALLPAIRRYVGVGGGPFSDRKDILEQLSCVTGQPRGLTDEERALVRRICEFRTIRDFGQPLSYLYRLGGVFARQNVSVDSISQETIAQLHRDVAAQLQRVIKELQSSRGLAYESFSRAEVARLESRVGVLTRALQRLGGQLTGGQPGLGVLADQVQQAAAAGASAAAAYAAGDYVTFGRGAYKAAGLTLQVLASTMDQSSPVPNWAALQNVDQELLSVRRELDGFLIEVEQYRRRLSIESNAVVADYLKNATRVENSRRRVRYDYGGMLQVALASYLVERNKEHFLERIDTIEGLITSFPDHLLTFAPMAPSGECGPTDYRTLHSFTDADPLGCVSVPTESTPYVLQLETSDQPFPLIVVNSSSPLFPVNFRGSVRKSDLIKIQLP
jgi:hypothetical protein